MHSIYHNATINRMFEIFSIVYQQKKTSFKINYSNDIPYVACDNPISCNIITIESISYVSLMELMSNMLKAYNMDFYALTNEFINEFIDKDGILKTIKFDYISVIAKWNNCGGRWLVCKAIDLGMYILNDKNLHELFIMFLMDPLGVINIMRDRINNSESKDFFDSVEYYVNKKIYSQLMNYCILKQLAYEKYIVDDVVYVILYKWIQLESDRVSSIIV